MNIFYLYELGVISLDKNTAKKIDLRDLGAYTPTEAAHYLHVPLSTLRAWVLGQTYVETSSGKERHAKPVVSLPKKKERLLSFYNLVEIHVLAAMRRQHEIPLPNVRKGLDYVTKQLGEARPLLRQDFLTDGFNLFVEKSGLLLNVSQSGQGVMRETLEKFLERIERDPKGIPIRLFPFSRHAGQEDARSIVIDSEIAFGRPVLAGTAIPTINIFDRFLAGEPTQELAKDFRVEPALIEEAIRCEQIRQRSA